MYKNILSFTCEVQQQFNGFQIQFPIQCKTKKVYLKAYYDDKNVISLKQPPIILITPSNSEQKLFEFELFNLESCKISPLNKEHMSLVVKEGGINNQKRVFFITKALKENLELFRNEAGKVYKMKNQKNNNTQQQQQQPKQSHIQKGVINNNNNAQNKGKSQQLTLKEQRQQMIQQHQKQVSQRRVLQMSNRYSRGMKEQMDEKILSKQLKQQVNLEQKKAKVQLPEGYLKQIPDNVLAYIMQFLDKKQVYQMRIVSKDFELLAFQIIKELRFPYEGDIPKEIAVNILNKAKYITKLTFGQFKNYPQIVFQDQVSTAHKDLQYVDFSHFNGLTSKIARRFIEKGPKIDTLIFPYLSKLSGDCLSVCQYYLKELKVLKFKSYSRSMHRNINISDECILNMVNLNKKLYSLNLVSIQQIFFEKIPSFIERNQEIAQKLLVLKVTNIHLAQQENVDFLENIKLLTNLQILKIGNILTQSKDGLYNEVQVPNDIIRSIGLSCKFIHSVTLGKWCTNIHVQIAAQYWKQNLVKFHVISNEVSDSSIKEITESCVDLRILKLKDCSKIQGSCFENMVCKKIQRCTLNLSDYEWNILQQIIKQKGANIKAFYNTSRRF